MWLTWHDTCDLWTLGGHISLSLQDLSRWKTFMKGLSHLDLHRGLKSHRMDDAPHSLEAKMMNVAP
jgi:hypothetical protein